MKTFFQGLVIGFIVMYAYLNRAEVFAPYREWFGGHKNERKKSSLQEEIDNLRYGFFFQRNDGTETTGPIVHS
jgi:hypothetical protein